MDTQNYETRIAELRRRLNGGSDDVKWCIELITKDDRDFKTKTQRKRLVAFAGHVSGILKDMGARIHRCDVFYWYTLTETSEILEQNWECFETALNVGRTIAEGCAGDPEVSLTFHHHGVRRYAHYPQWCCDPLPAERKCDLLQHHKYARARAEEDVGRMLDAAKEADVRLNIEITTPGDFAQDKKWEILYFTPRQLKRLLGRYRDRQLGLVLDISHLALGAQHASSVFPPVQEAILGGSDPDSENCDRGGYGGGQTPDATFQEPLRLLGQYVEQIHVNNCTGKSVEFDHGRPVGRKQWPCPTVIDWPGFLRNVDKYVRKDVVWVPEIQKSDDDSHGRVNCWTRDALCFIANCIHPQ